VIEPVGERGSPPVVPSNPNSRVGRSRSPIAQGRDQMEAIVVGIDVSKDRLDVHVRPAGTVLSFGRDAAGIEGLIGELLRVVPQLIAVEATGGFETVVVASLAAASLPVVVIRRKCAPLPSRSADAPRPTRSTPR
jgi:transposase